MLAGPLAGQHRADGEIALPPLEGLGQRNGCLLGGGKLDRVQEPHRLGIQVAQHLGLQAVGDHGKQDMAGKVGRGVSPKPIRHRARSALMSRPRKRAISALRKEGLVPRPQS